MSYLRRAGIDFDKEYISGAGLEHEVEPVQPGKLETGDHLFDRTRHLNVLYQAHHGGVPGRGCLADHFEVKAGKHSAFPAKDRAGCLPSCYKGLDIDHWPMTQQGWPDQSLILVDDRPL